MIKLDQKYAQQDFIDFLQDTFLQDYVRDVRPVGTAGHAIHKATSLGRSEDLDLQIFEFEYSGAANKRVALTKEAFQIMKQSATFHALAVFYGQDSDDWRLSFMTANPERTEQGKVAVAYSNPRRYSFFLGTNAKINTANRFLIKGGQIKNFDDLLSRFNVEIVTKEFFDNYKKLFDRLLAYLNKDHAFQSFAGRNGVETANFAKKLLGQIVFLYFLQRKGWLGAKKGDSISMGNKDFLRSLFSKSVDRKENFYNTYLEPLFYGALNKYPEKAGSYYRSYFDCQIPFLNGGLFEPPQDYDWEHEFLMLPDKLFSKNPNDPTHGDGILDIFDLYNFTVDESDFLDKEVSVDPEMLGKVFENLLEENLRKGKGIYYTPREIVNYMCEESVVNYLTTETGLTPEDIKNKYFPSYNVLGDGKFQVRDVSVSEQIIESLKNIKIVDPACGSGAFLVGMLQQITHLRYDLEGRSKLLGRRETVSSEYEIKKQTIQNCIYGVDIDPGAVDIAKLRLWLSLVVDYDLEEIEPLPNLDYKIMQGNSLLEELVLGDTTIKLYDRQTIQNALGSKKMKTLFEQESQVSLFDGENDKVLKTMRALQLKYFGTSDSENKKKIRGQIDKIEHDLIDVSIKAEVEQLSAQRLNIRTMPGIGILPEDAKRLMNISSKENQIMAVLDELKKTGTKPFFLWHLHFADVFEEKGGFDVVIANPPYIKEDINKNAFNGLRKTDCYQGKMDIWYLFGSKGLDLLKKQGVMCFIATNNWVSNDGASKFRNKIINESKILNYIDFGDYKVFAAGVQTMVFILQKDEKEKVYEVKYGRLKNNRATPTIVNDLLNSGAQIDNNDFIKYNVRFEKDEYRDQYINFLPPHISSLLTKIKQIGTTKLFADEIFSGIDVMQDFVNKKHLDKLGIQFKVGEGIFVISEAEFIETDWNQNERKILKPYFTTKEINRKKANPKNRYWVIYSSPGINKEINEYPNIKRHLDRFNKIITSVNRPYGLHRTRDEQVFLGEKILSIRKCAIPSFSYVSYPCYVSRAFLVIKTDRMSLKYLTNVLNSKLVEFWLKYKGKLQGNQYQIDKNPLMSIPLLIPENLDIEAIIQEGDEKVINEKIYSLYKITDTERKIMEDSTK